MKIGIITMRHATTRTSPIMQEAIRLLSDWGAMIDLIYPEEQLTDLASVRVEHDLYILKSGSELALSLAGVLHSQGARFMNPYRSCITTQNKILVSRLLRAAEVPAPRSWVTGDFNLLAEIVEETPLIIKPYIGHRGAGTHIVRSARSWNSTDFALLRREVANPSHRLLIELLNQRNDKINHVIKVGAIDDAVVCVRVARGHDQIHRRHAAVALLYLSRIVAIALHEIELERNRFFRRDLFDE